MPDIPWDEHLAPFPPRVPDGWVHNMPFSIVRGRGMLGVRLVAACKDLHLPRSYLVEVDALPGTGRTYLDAGGGRHVAAPGYKHPNPPYIDDFEEAVRVANAYMDG